MRRVRAFVMVALAIVAVVLYAVRSRIAAEHAPADAAPAIPAQPLPTPEPPPADAATPDAPAVDAGDEPLPPLRQRVAQQVQRFAVDCTRPLPRGSQRWLEGEVVVAVRSHRLTITRVVLPQAAPALRRCLEQHASAVALDVPDQPDLVDTSMHVAVPPL